MELVKGDNFAAQFEGFSQLPMVRQLGFMFGLAAAVALGVVIILWSQKPTYGILYSSLTSRDAGAVMEALQQQGVNYRVDEVSGAIMVPADKVHELRLKLADADLPKSAGVGFDILEKKQEFGTSQFIETARYQRALEGELARSVTTLNTVQGARVHLALPKQSVFVRDQKEPSASVLVDLYPGRVLEDAQVAAITHLVASSIPNLKPSRVTVVDQNGHLLSDENKAKGAARNQEQFEYTRRLEDTYVSRIDNILAPVLGPNAFRAQVAADLDFTVTEQTQETYNPDLPALRSEQVIEEKTVGQGAEGIPGALSNQPPGEAAAPEVAKGGQGAETAPETPIRTNKRSTANYELDRTISHTRLATGAVKRLSVAVVVDDGWTTNEEGARVRQPRSPEELERITALVKEAVGYNAQRGDTLNVINASFTPTEAPAPLPEPPLWKQAWLWDILKQVGAVVLVGLFAFGVLRVLRSLANVKVVGPPAQEAGELAEDQLSLAGPAAQVRLPAPQQAYEQQVNMAKQMVQEDPKRVAQLVKTWIASDE